MVRTKLTASLKITWTKLTMTQNIRIKIIFLLIIFLESSEFPVIVISLIDINYYYYLLMLFILLNEIQIVFFYE